MSDPKKPAAPEREPAPRPQTVGECQYKLVEVILRAGENPSPRQHSEIDEAFDNLTRAIETPSPRAASSPVVRPQPAWVLIANGEVQLCDTEEQGHALAKATLVKGTPYLLRLDARKSAEPAARTEQPTPITNCIHCGQYPFKLTAPAAPVVEQRELPKWITKLEVDAEEANKKDWTFNGTVILRLIRYIKAASQRTEGEGQPK